MDRLKQYTIKINGVQENIDAINSLIRQLETLSDRIDNVSQKSIKVDVAMPTVSTTTTTSTGGGKRTAALSEEEKLQKQIAQTEEKRIAYQKELYQRLLAEKDLLKEVVKDQKERAASERLTANEYNLNTMQGLKEKLADIKAVMQTADFTDTDFFDKLTQDADALNKKLLEIEKSYGQFGRQVGNYPVAAEGFKKLTIEVNGVTREFDNAKQALMSLKKERDTLGVMGGKTTKEFKELDETVKKLASDIKDMEKSSAAMDNLLDTMESVVALASAGKGIASFFGLDGGEIDKAMKQLLALQNALKGIETINKQIKTQEGLGKYFAGLNSSIDSANFKMKRLIVSLGGTSTAAKAAAGAVNLLSKALKAIGIGAAIFAVSKLVESFQEMITSSKSLEDNLKELNEDVLNEGAKVYAKNAAEINVLINRVNQFNGTAQEEKKLLKELKDSHYELVGDVKNLAEAKERLIENAPKYLKMLKMEAEASAYLAAYVSQYTTALELQRKAAMLDINALKEKFENDAKDAMAASKIYLEGYTRFTQRAQELKDELYSKEDTNSDKTKNEVVDYEKELQNLRLKAMKDGLNKRLKELEEEKRQTLNKLKGNEKAYLEAESLFERRRLKLVSDYTNEIAKELSKQQEYNIKLGLEIDKEKLDNSIEELSIEIDKISKDIPRNFTLMTNEEFQKMFYTVQTNVEAMENYLQKLPDDVKKSLERLKKENSEEYQVAITRRIMDEYINFLPSGAKDELSNIIDDENAYYEKANELLKKYKIGVEQTLNESFHKRILLTQEYYDETIELVRNKINERYELQKEALENEREAQIDANVNAYEEQEKANHKIIDDLQETLQDTSQLTEDEVNTLTEQLNETYQKQTDLLEAHKKKTEEITREYDNKINRIELEHQSELSTETSKYYDKAVADYRDFLSKINKERDKQPITNEFGIINLKKTKDNYKEIEHAASTSLTAIIQKKWELSDDFDNGLIDKENYNAVLSQLNDLETETKDAINVINEDLKGLGTELWKSINEWVQYLGNSIGQIMSSISEITSNEYDRQIEAQEKWIDKYEDLLEKQKDITKKYADSVNAIEDELASARGDRRQHLIDQLNQEIAAQRQSLEEEKRIEREKEKAEQQKKKLEIEQAKAEKNMNLWQARINAAMAVSMAAVNKWPIPAIPMMAMAAAIGAAQIAAVKSQNIPTYATGGVIEGKPHSAGGVKAIVAGKSPIELEGNEYIIRKSTATENVSLLDYINKSQRKLNLDDFIEFYSSKPRATIKSIKSRFADGGQLITPNIDISESLGNTIVVKDDSVYQVSVVDINQAQDNVKRVQLLAGL